MSGVYGYSHRGQGAHVRRARYRPVSTPSIVNIVLLVIVAIGVYSPYGPYWAVPGAYLRIEVLAGGLGLINALGNLGGFVGPYLVGWLTDVTGSAATGYYALAGLLVVGAVLTWVVVKPKITPTTP